MKLGVDGWVTSGKYKLPFRSEGERERERGGRGEGRDIALHLFGVDTKNVPSPAISWTKCSDRASQGFWPVNTMYFVLFLLFYGLRNLFQWLSLMYLLHCLNNKILFIPWQR